MDDLKTIIYLLAGVAALVGMIAKNARKSADQPPAAPPSPWMGMEEWGSVDEEWDIDQERPAPAAHPAAKPAASVQESAEAAACTEGRAVVRETYAEGGRNTKITQRSVAPEPAGHPEEYPLENFDLREAVIYSEILKPKFEESFNA